MHNCRRADELWSQSSGWPLAARPLCRSVFKGREARRPASCAAHEIRACSEPQSRESPRPDCAANSASGRRRGDRVMNRREFVTLLGSAAAWPLAARAQQAAKVPTIGFLGATTPLAEGQRLAAFVQRLRQLGWMEGRNVSIEVRWAEGRSERFAEIAAEFVRFKVDVIVTVATPLTLAAKQATSVIPIVFVAVSDPVGTGLVASLARPGGNITGLADQISDTAGKKLEFLREVVSDLRRLAIMANVGNPASVLEMGEAQAAARKLGLEVTTSEIR